MLKFPSMADKPAPTITLNSFGSFPAHPLIPANNT